MFYLMSKLGFHLEGHFHDFPVAARAAKLQTWASPFRRPTFGYATPEQCCNRARVPAPCTPKDQHPKCIDAVLLFFFSSQTK